MRKLGVALMFVGALVCSAEAQEMQRNALACLANDAVVVIDPGRWSKAFDDTKNLEAATMLSFQCILPAGSTFTSNMQGNVGNGVQMYHVQSGSGCIGVTLRSKGDTSDFTCRGF